MSIEGFNQSNTASIDGLNSLYYDYLTDGTITMENGDLLGGNIISTKQLFINGAQIVPTQNTITITGPIGPTGPKGDTGPAGPSGGEKGDKGDKGEKGDKGDSDSTTVQGVVDGVQTLLTIAGIAGVVTYFNGIIATINTTISALATRVLGLEDKTTYMYATALSPITTFKSQVTINDGTTDGIKMYNTGRIEADHLLPLENNNILTIGKAGNNTIVKGDLTIMDGYLDSSGNNLNIGRKGLNFVNIGSLNLTTTTNILGTVLLNGRPLSNPFFDSFIDQFR